MYDQKWLEESLSIPIYKTAFIHRSYLNESDEQIDSNERLEFLGDSVLSLVISSYLFSSRKNDSEGALTNMRSFIVKTQSLAMAAKKLNLGNFLMLSKGEELSGGRENIQLLANTYEALVGAIYINEGYFAVEKFVLETLLPLFQEELRSGPPKDSKSQLQELTQTQTKLSPKYKILETEGPDHAKKFMVGVFLKGEKIGEGSGLSKQVAEEEAAKMALTKLIEST